MKNQLPKSERKYRSKIIAEEHLDKYWQGVLDEYMGRRVTRFLGVTYKKCYIAVSKLADKYAGMGNVYPLFIDEARGDMVEKI